MQASPKKLDQKFTYKDYLLWPNDERWELINGEAYDMSPAPARSHQSILLSLARIISDITDKGQCETYIAPFDVRLSEITESEEDSASDENITTVVQPDISVFCNPDLLDDRGAYGAPDLVVEILSPSTSYKDQTVKLALYEGYKVKEYWIVNGDVPSVMIYRLGKDGTFDKPDYYRLDEEVTSRVLSGSAIPVSSFIQKKTAS